jgi:hypothetical protein
LHILQTPSAGTWLVMFGWQMGADSNDENERGIIQTAR